MPREDFIELVKLGHRNLDRLRSRAKEIGKPLNNLRHLGWVMAKSKDPTKFNMHYLGISKRGAIWLFNHTKDDIAYQIAEWTMTQGGWDAVCPCVRVLIFIRYGKKGAWGLNNRLPVMYKATKEHIHKFINKGLPRLARNPQYILWTSDSMLLSDPNGQYAIYWLKDRHEKAFISLRSMPKMP